MRNLQAILLLLLCFFITAVKTSDGKNLYVADMGVSKTFRYDIQPDGSLNNKAVFINESSALVKRIE